MSKLSRSLARKAIIGVTAAVAPIVAVGIDAPANAIPATTRQVGQPIPALAIPAPVDGLMQDATQKFNDAFANAQAALTTAGDKMTAALHEAQTRLNDAMANARETVGKAGTSLKLSPEEPGEQ